MDSRTIHLLESALDALEYFEQREDADHDGERFIPNKEMHHASSLRKAIAPFKNELPASWQMFFERDSRSEEHPKSTICRFPKEIEK